MFPLREGLLPYKEVMVDLNTIFFPKLHIETSREGFYRAQIAPTIILSQ